VDGGQRGDEHGLEGVGVLIFINQNVEKTGADLLRDRGFQQQAVQMDQQIVVVQQAVLGFETGVVIENQIEIISELNQMRLVLLNGLVNGAVFVDRCGKEADPALPCG
jgi:hypothetical protein